MVEGKVVTAKEDIIVGHITIIGIMESIPRDEDPIHNTQGSRYSSIIILGDTQDLHPATRTKEEGVGAMDPIHPSPTRSKIMQIGIIAGTMDATWKI